MSDVLTSDICISREEQNYLRNNNYVHIANIPLCKSSSCLTLFIYKPMTIRNLIKQRLWDVESEVVGCLQKRSVRQFVNIHEGLTQPMRLGRTWILSMECVCVRERERERDNVRKLVVWM